MGKNLVANASSDREKKVTEAAGHFTFEVTPRAGEG